LNFTPGLVGGHCIGVDPYYLTYKAEQYGYHSQIILAGRRINDNMGKYVGECVIKKIVKAGININNAKVAILGFTFKENCPDIRNSKVIDIVNELREYDIEPIISDPIADKGEAMHEYGVSLTDVDNIRNIDVIIIAVAHNEYVRMSMADFDRMFAPVDNNQKIIADVKGILDKNEIEKLGYSYWRL